MSQGAKTQSHSPAASEVQVSNPILAAIERHKAAWAAFSSDERDDAGLSDKEDAALMELALTPCASDAEFVEKMKYMLARHDRLCGIDECPEVLAAIRQHTQAHP